MPPACLKQTKPPTLDGIRCGKSWMLGQGWKSDSFSEQPIPLLPPLLMEMSHSVPSLQLVLVALCCLHCSGGKSLTLIVHFQCQSSPPNFVFAASHSISSSFHTPPPWVSGGCDTADGSDDPVSTANLMWIINK